MAIFQISSIKNVLPLHAPYYDHKLHPISSQEESALKFAPSLEEDPSG